jgi:hypothetical protein
MANPDAPWGFSDLRNSVDSELVASAETATEAYPDEAGNRDDSGSARYYGRYGHSVENKEKPTYYYLGKRSSNTESHLPCPMPYNSKRSADAVDTAAKDNVSSSYNRYLYGYANSYAYGYGSGYPYTYGYGYRKRSADAEAETVADASMSHYYFGRSYGYPYGHGLGLGFGKRSADAEPPSNANTVKPRYYYGGYNGYPNFIGGINGYPIVPNHLIGKRSADAVDTVAKDNMSPSFNRYTYGYGYPYASGYGYPYAYGYGYPYASGYGYPYAYGYRYLGKRSADAKPEIMTDSGLSHYIYVRYRPYGNHYRLIGKRSADTKPEIPLDTVVKDNDSPMYTAAAAGYAHHPYGKPSADAEPQTDADAGTHRYYYA